VDESDPDLKGAKTNVKHDANVEPTPAKTTPADTAKKTENW